MPENEFNQSNWQAMLARTAGLCNANSAPGTCNPAKIADIMMGNLDRSLP
jgi:hypothetical protein